jgi:glucose-6-phosphate dehydrogenase assembly protein OpcA
MADTLTETPQPTWHLADPDAFETELSVLWREAARDGSVSRALMSNLIVIVEFPDSNGDITDLGPSTPFVDVVCRHPARVILLGYTPGRCELRAPKNAQVTVLTFGPRSARYGVEMIAVRAACADASIPSILRGLTVGDVPTAVWWASDFSRVDSSDPVEAITSMCRRFIFDSSRWSNVGGGARALVSTMNQRRPPQVADVNWNRLTTLRRAIVHALSAETSRGELDSGVIAIRYKPAYRAQAWLMFGWLQSRINSARVVVPTEARELATNLEVQLKSGQSQVVAAQDAAAVTLTITNRPALQMPLPHWSDGEIIASELAGMSHHRALRDSLRTIAGHV